jgi:hypothetical protein
MRLSLSHRPIWLEKTLAPFRKVNLDQRFATGQETA